MNREDAVKLFNEKIKFYSRRSKVNQSAIAELLNITPSAVSQKFKSNIMMNLNELKVIANAMKLVREEHFELQTLLTKIRSGENTGDDSPFNRFMRECRRKKKYNLAKLSQLSGISPIRLRSFEEDFYISFTEDDAEVLGRIYDVSPDLILSKLPFNVSQNVPYSMPSAEAGIQSVADRDIDKNQRFRRIPVVEFDEFKTYSPQIDIFAFGDLRSSSELIYDIAREVIAVKLPLSYLKLPFNGDGYLLLSDKKPFVFIAKLFFVSDIDRKLHVLQKKFDDDKFYELDSENNPTLFTGKILWSLAVAEVKICPEILA